MIVQVEIFIHSTPPILHAPILHGSSNYTVFRPQIFHQKNIFKDEQTPIFHILAALFWILIGIQSHNRQTKL